MYVVGIAGKARHGKDTVANLIVELAQSEYDKNFGKFALAAPLKARVFAELAGEYSYSQVFDDKPPKVRKVLQEVGTEKGRNFFGPDLWTYQVEAFLRYFTSTMPFVDGMVIPDVRFPNEVLFARYGGRVAEPIEVEIGTQVAEELSYTDEREMQLLEEGDFETLYDLDRRYVELYNELVAAEKAMSPGIALWIESDRPTLTGEAASHASETALDFVDKERGFDGIIVNNLDTTFDDLREQLRPYLKELLS